MAKLNAPVPRFYGGLPTIVREAMLQTVGNTPKAALLIDALYFQEIKPGTWLKETEIRDLVPCSRRLSYEGLRTVYFVRRKDPNHTGRGRPAYEYRMPSALEVAFELELKGVLFIEQAAYSGRLRAGSLQRHTDMLLSISDGLFEQDLQSLKTYRLALHRELILSKQFDGLRMARGRLAERLGVSVRTSREYDKILNTKIIAEFEHIELRDKDWRNAPKVVGEKRPEWIEVYKPGSLVAEKMPYTMFLCWQNMKLGYKVVKVRRLVNTYYPGPHWPGYWWPENRVQHDTRDIFERQHTAIPF